ncbi:MAG TPA: hypothetical protein VGJ25_16215 [Gaiellaceae bacterium]
MSELRRDSRRGAGRHDQRRRALPALRVRPHGAGGSRAGLIVGEPLTPEDDDEDEDEDDDE